MIGKFENFIKNSGFELTWIIYYVIFQISVGILNFLILGVDRLNGSIDFIEVYKNVWKFSHIVFTLIFVIATVTKNGFSKLISTFFKFCFFYVLFSMFINRAPELIFPRKYEDIDTFIIEENISKRLEYRETLLEKLLKKIFNKN